jgi:RHS repeat-associated protein
MPTTCVSSHQYDAAEKTARTSEIYDYDAETDPTCMCDELQYTYDGNSPRVFLDTRGRATNSTGKERDTESNLDMFGARYYGSSLGRFMTPDWEAAPTDVPYAHFGNPQSLNLYSYVQNNPTAVGDPDGHDPDVDFQNQALEDMFNRIAAESPSFSAELDAAKADHNIQVTVNEVGVQKLPDHAPGDAVVTLNADGSIKVVINVKRDDERTSEHELGHEKDARTNTAQFRADGKQDAKDKGGPNEKPHDERPIEQRANKFRDQVERERKQHRQEEKERKRREKEERKKKANENQPS